MESLNIKKLKTESKGSKIQKQKQLQRIGNLLRYAEICVLMVLISRVSLQQLPLALKNSTEYFRGFTISPLVVFLVGNMIIITLFAQSGKFSPPSPTKRGSEADLYLEFLQNSTTVYQNIEIGDQKRLSITDGRKIKKEGEKQSENRRKVEEKKKMKVKRDICEVKEYRRCQSEIMLVKKGTTVESEIKEKEKEKRGVLQRCESESDKTKRTVSSSSKHEIEEEDRMSNDEFRRTVEAFISRQQRLRLQELQNL